MPNSDGRDRKEKSPSYHLDIPQLADPTLPSSIFSLTLTRIFKNCDTDFHEL
jgi:hypothetical protein